MRSLLSLTFACAVGTVLTTGHGGPFTGHTVVRFTPRNDHQLKQAYELLEKFQSIDVWKYPSIVNNSVDVRLSPLNRDDVIHAFARIGMSETTLMQDVQKVLGEQTAARHNSEKKNKAATFEYSHYHTLDEIYAWMENITNAYKDKASLFNVTSSFEGRPLMGIKISSQPQDMKRPAFYFEGGIHAREWISPATVIYMTGQMLDQYGKDAGLTAMVDAFDWYILPVTNPDGYVYTWKSDKTRLWRKTRSKQGVCVGVDPNRNWDVEWCKEGASKDPCSDTYCGPKAFSEVEVVGVANFLQRIDNVKAFIDFHSYSQLWMSPYGYTKKLPSDFKTQDEGSTLAVDALTKLYGTQYKHGTLANTVYISSGSSADWTYAKAGIKYSYGVELRDTGEFGFLLPEAQIVPTGIETLAALVALADYVAEN